MMSEDNKGRMAGFKPLRFITEKIRNKVLVILLGSALGTLIVAVVALLSINIAQRTIDEVVDRKGAIVTLANNAEIELLLARELDQRYLLNYRALGFENARGEYVTKVEQHVQRVGEIFDEIQQKDPGSEVILQNIDDARKNLRDYLSSFLAVVNLSEKRGYKDLGLIGEFSGDIGDIEETLSGADQPNLLVAVQRIRGYEKDYLLLGERQYIRRVADEVANLQEQLERSLLVGEVKQRISILADEYLSKFEEVVGVDREIADGTRVYRSAINNMIPTLTTVVEAVQADQAVAITAMKQQSRIALIIVVVASIVTILLGIAAAFFFSRRLTKQIDNIMDMFGNIGIGDFSARAEILTHDELGEMAESLNAMLDNTLTLIQSREERDAIQDSIMRLLTEISDLADGDLTARAEVTEEVTGAIADSFNNMAEQLSRVVKDVKEASMLVGSSSSDVDQVTRKLSQASEEQAAKIRDAITTIERIAESIREVADSATESARVSSTARSSAREGSDAVRKTNQAMSSIKENMRGTARTIKRLGESSQEIGNIIQIINDIADRTSILALNASIQAAMAGEAGRGFAVVAEEVQRLAERSATSTKQIETLISTIQGEISEAGISMERSIQHVVDGTELADEAYGKLEEIETVSNQLAELVESISRSARRQSAESENITKLMHEVGLLTGETTAATRETTASMEKITSTSRRLEESIAVFKIEEEAASA
jgi:twitching motility protein PilJ